MESIVVVPTVREASIAEFLAAWEDEFAAAQIIVVQDGPRRSFDVAGANVHHFAREDIREHLGDAAWIIPSGSGCIRSFGCWLAWQMGAEMIVTLDDDVRPHQEHPGFLAAHERRLSSSADAAWVSTLDDAKPRGMPYFETGRNAPVVVNHGLWDGVPDFDAPTQLVASRVPIGRGWSDRTIARGSYLPMCSMNLAWRSEFAPAMYFLLMGPDYAFDRFGDIWCGVLAKRIADHLGFAINSGSPAVAHERASDVFVNLAKESRGMRANETFWRAVDSVVLSERTVAGAYIELADRLPLDDADFALLRGAMSTWAGLFAGGRREADRIFARGAVA